MSGQGCPAHFDAARRVWVIDDPAQARAVLLDPQTFPPDNALRAYTELTPASLRALTTARFALPPTLASNSEPSHRPIRGAVARFLSPKRVDAVEPLVQRLAADAVGEVRTALGSGEPVDLVGLIAGPVPAATLFALFDLGPVPAELKRWSQDSLELFWGAPEDARQLRLAETAADYYRWLRSLVEASRATSGADLFSELVALGLDDERVCAAAYFLLIAGQETTSMLISSILLRLLAEPDRWRAAARPEVAAEAVEAALREESSVPTWRRTTKAAVDLDGVTLPPRAEVLLTLTGTGGDADLAFGVGIHRCLGAALARMESRVIVQTLAAALPDLVLVETAPPRIDLLSFASPQRVLVRSGNQ